MANEILRNSDGDALPQRLKDGASVTPATGDTTKFELYDGTVEGKVAHDGVATEKPLPIGGVYKASPSDVADGDRTDIRTTAKGDVVINSLTADEDAVEAIPSSDHILAGGSIATPKTSHIDVSTSGESTLVAAVASTQIRVLSLSVTTDAAHKVSFLDGTGGSALDAVYCADNSGKVEEASQGFLFQTTAGNALIANLGGANNTSIRVTYVEV